jgi:N-acetyl-gamma-glutamyl-phosphate reductase
VRAAIIGASGTTGTELARLLLDHPVLSVSVATSRTHAGRSASTIDPAAPDIVLTHPDDVGADDCDLVFACLPHGQSANVVERWAAHHRVIDLSGDLRLADAAIHERVYGSPRSAALADEAVYGLPELDRAAIASARVVANPGCYPTCSAIPLLPLTREGWIDGTVVIDAKSGVSGAGRASTPTTHFCSVHEDVRPYKVGRSHRHVAEIEQSMGRVGTIPRLLFNPHLVPLERGMLATMVVPLTPGHGADEARACLESAYADDPFVRVLPESETARIRSVAGTNRVAISVHEVSDGPEVVIVSAIDNLVKGAAGQAVQNANLMLGLDEHVGLRGW